MTALFDLLPREIVLPEIVNVIPKEIFFDARKTGKKRVLLRRGVGPIQMPFDVERTPSIAIQNELVTGTQTLGSERCFIFPLGVRRAQASYLKRHRVIVLTRINNLPPPPFLTCSSGSEQDAIKSVHQ
jgi:hypothetical protein